MSAVSNQSELYQKYIPDYQLSNCSDGRVKNLEKRVDSIVKRIHREQTRFCCCSNGNIIEELKEELKATIKERDLLYRRVLELTQVLEESNRRRIKLKAKFEAEMDEKIQARSISVGLGIGYGAVGAVFLGLGTAWSVVCIAGAAIAGVAVGDSMTKKINRI